MHAPQSALMVPAALLLVAIVPSPPAAAVADFGKISGTVSIETGNPAATALLPAGPIVEIDLACSQPGKNAAPCGTYLILTKKGGPHSLPLRAELTPA